MDIVFGLHHWLAGLEHQLEPAQQRELLRRIVQQLRVNMRDRIKQQREPSGKQFTPRKRSQIGRIRRQAGMFQRIGRDIKTEYSADHASVGFAGRTASIAKVHQQGLVVKPGPNISPVRYAVRELVGWSEEDKRWVAQQFQDYFK